MVIPAAHYTETLLDENRLDQTREFISTCGNNHFFINKTSEGKFSKHFQHAFVKGNSSLFILNYFNYNFIMYNIIIENCKKVNKGCVFFKITFESSNV